MWFQVYKDKAGKFRWRLKASNGRIIADSGQGYTRRWEALKSCQRLYHDMQGFLIRAEDEHGKVLW